VSGPPQLDWPGRPAEGAPAALPDPEARTRAAARLLHEFLQESGHDMKFMVDKVTGKTIVRIYNRASGELVRQVPSEEVVRIAELLRQETASSAIDVRA
jgi:flagellar protein FlaG